MAVTGLGDSPIKSSWVSFNANGKNIQRGNFSLLYKPIGTGTDFAIRDVFTDWFFNATSGSAYSQSLSASIVTVATLNKVSSFLKTLSSSVVTVASLSKVTARLQTLSSSVAVVSSLAKVTSFVKTLSSSVSVVASMTQTLFAVARDVVRMMMGIGR